MYLFHFKKSIQKLTFNCFIHRGQFDKMLTQSSDILQRFAVAWEQVVFENIPFVSSNRDQFADTQMRLKQVSDTI